MTITIDAQVTPTFTQVGPFCNGASIPGSADYFAERHYWYMVACYN